MQHPDMRTEIHGVSDAICIKYSHLQDKGRGMRAHGIGLCILPNHGGRDRFVVWTLIYDEEREFWFAEQGDYCETVERALEYFEKRAA